MVSLWLRLLTTFCCFDAGSQVLMADKTTKNIEDIEIGDMVMSLNEDNGEFIPQKTTALDCERLVRMYLYAGIRRGGGN